MPVPTNGPAVLRELLTRTERISDLRDLFRVLGYQPAWEPVPPGPWLGPGGAAEVVDAAQVARHGAFRVFAVASPDPRSAARAGAARLANSAERGLVCGLAPAQPDTIWLATWRPGVRGARPVRAVAIALARPGGAAIALLERLTPLASESALALSLRVGDALATEPVSNRRMSAPT